MELKLTGQAAIRRELLALGKAYPKAFGAALYKLGVAILSDALPRTPVEFGVLRSSGYVAPPSGKGESPTVEVGFGTVYAVPQHERMDYRHPRGGGPKFLENAINALSPRALGLLKKWMDDPKNSAGWSQAGGVPTRPATGSSTVRRPSQKRRLARAASNVKKRTGR